MGMAASQARLLTLTSRLSDLELKAQQISNSKIRLAMQSESVSEAYSEALNKKTLQYKTIDGSGNFSYQDLNANMLMTYDPNSTDAQHLLKTSNGRLLVSQDTATAYESSGNTLEKFLNNLGYTSVAPTTQTTTDDTGGTDGTGGTTGRRSTATTTTTTTTNTNTSTTTTTIPTTTTTTTPTLQWSDPVMSTNNRGTVYTSTATMPNGKIATMVNNVNLGVVTISTQGTSKQDPAISVQGVSEDDAKAKFLKAAGLPATTTTTTTSGTTTPGTGTTTGGARRPTGTVTPTPTTTTSGARRTALPVGTTITPGTTGTAPTRRSALPSGTTTTTGTTGTTGTRRDSGTTGTTGTPGTTGTTGTTGTNTTTTPAAGTYDPGAVKYYTNIFNAMTSGGYVTASDDCLSNSDWLYNQFNNGNLSLYKYNAADNNGTGGFDSISWESGDPSIVEKSDAKDTAKAEAEYDSEMAKIQTKDKRFDLDLNLINTEHSALQTEVDSVKKVIDKNIERSFKIFEA